MSLEAAQRLTAGQIPKPNGPIKATRDQPFAIAADCETGHGFLVPAKYLTLPAVDVVELGEIISAAGGETLAVGCEGDLIDAAGVVGGDGETGRCGCIRLP